MSESKKVVLPDGIKVTDSYVTPKLSANALFHFMGKEEYLLNKLRDRAIIPRYTLEDVAYLELPKCQRMYYPMVCFCDINLHKMNLHCENYGSYGIAFSKEWGIKNGIQPINYVNANGDFVNMFRDAFKEGVSNKETNPLKDFLLESLRYMKPIQGQNICHEDDKLRNFMDECEWRFLPHDTEILPAIVASATRSVESHNEALERDDRYWLKFEYKDIRHIIVPNTESSFKIMDFLDSLSMNVNERKTLYTKIMVMHDFMEDV